MNAREKIEEFQIRVFTFTDYYISRNDLIFSDCLVCHSVVRGVLYFRSKFKHHNLAVGRTGSGGDAPMRGDSLAPVNWGEVPQIPIVTSSSAPVG